MIAAVYGLQVRHMLHVKSLLLILFSGDHLHLKARVHVGGVDGDLHLSVCLPSRILLVKLIIASPLQLPSVQLLPSSVFLLVHGRL